MPLANHNVDTLATNLEALLARLEAVEAILVNVPGIGEYAAIAAAGTAAAATLVTAGDQAYDTVAGALPTPPAAVAPAPVPRPAPVPAPATAPKSAPVGTAAGQTPADRIRSLFFP